jgi:hypothetical protein
MACNAVSEDDEGCSLSGSRMISCRAGEVSISALDA